MRQAERAGTIAAPDELRDIVGGLPYAADEIDSGLALLVSPDGRIVGESLSLADLDEDSIACLLRERLIKIDEHGTRELSKKGRDLVGLLAEYADARHQWTSLIGRSDSQLERMAITLYRELIVGAWTEAAQSWHERITDQYRLGVVKGVEEALETIDRVLARFGVNTCEIRALFQAIDRDGEDSSNG